LYLIVLQHQLQKTNTITSLKWLLSLFFVVKSSISLNTFWHVSFSKKRTLPVLWARARDLNHSRDSWAIMCQATVFVATSRSFKCRMRIYNRLLDVRKLKIRRGFSSELVKWKPTVFCGKRTPEKKNGWLARPVKTLEYSNDSSSVSYSMVCTAIFVIVYTCLYPRLYQSQSGQ